jgi:glyoxylase-like metal-dependent hydrolase (beta-lactamase superfamily II)
VERAGERVEVLRVQATAHPHKTTNIYVIEDDDGGVVVYETGSVGNAEEIRQAAMERGGITRIVLSHAHADHRGGASRLDAPVYCHPAERPGAEGDGWLKDGYDLTQLHPAIRDVLPRLLAELDGGPLKIEGELNDGDTIAGFEILHLPGHTPGLIGLWRESDRLAIVSDAVFMWDPFTIDGLPGPVRLPPPAIRPDDRAARDSLRRIAALDPAAVWLGHYGPITGDVRAQLEHAADAN